MTQQERDTSIRILRDQLALANQNCVAAITELRASQTLFRTFNELIDGCLRDAAMRAVMHDVPDGLPSSERVRYLLSELRTNTTTAEECKTLLGQAGYPVT